MAPSFQSLVHSLTQLIQTVGQFSCNMDAKNASLPLLQNFHVTASLGGLYDSERIAPSGNRQIHRIITCDL